MRLGPDVVPRRGLDLKVAGIGVGQTGFDEGFVGRSVCILRAHRSTHRYSQLAHTRACPLGDGALEKGWNPALAQHPLRDGTKNPAPRA